MSLSNLSKIEMNNTTPIDEKKEVSNSPLPQEFLTFLTENGLDPSIYISASHSTPRYIRLKPSNTQQQQQLLISDIETQLNCQLKQLNWLPYFYCLPPNVKIATTNAYQQGQIYGIDAASGAAVLALDVMPGDHVLDLCAAPGAKLCLILDIIGSSGSVTGVDVARHRLAAARTLVLKYGLGDRCRLFVADGTAFSIVPLRDQSNFKSCSEEVMNNREIYGEWKQRRPWKERKKVSRAGKCIASETQSRIQDPELLFYGGHSGVVGLSKHDVYQGVNDPEISKFGYDKVLVDAECTHDGSIKHIQKFEQWGWTTLSRRVLDAERTDDLNVLQLKLLNNGFRLLKDGGFLVYSTCSLTVAQNENIVEQFLSQHTCAELVEIDIAKNWPCKPARLPKTLRFDPLTSSTSGLFVAKFTKQNIHLRV